MLAVKCSCGKVYQVPEEMEGRQARCKACGAVVTFQASPPSITRPIPLERQTEYQGPQASEGGYEIAQEDLAKYRVAVSPTLPPRPRHATGPALIVGNEYVASTPGNVRVNFTKYWMAYPLWPTLWIACLAFFLVMAVTVGHVWATGAAVSAAACIYYWILIFEHFKHGCALPGIVLSDDRRLVAVYSDLSMRPGQSHPYIRVLRQPLHLARVPTHTGARIATIALYSGRPEEEAKWRQFDPKVVSCVVSSKQVAERVLKRIPVQEWENLLHGINQLETPYRPGLYRISKY